MWKALDNPWVNRAGNLVFAAGAIQAGIRWVMGLPLNLVGILLLAAGVALIALPKFQRFLPPREAPVDLKAEIATVQRELVRHENRRQGNGGSIWPIERPYKDLPTEQWMRHGSRLRLKDSDRKAVSDAYEQVLRFNDKMLLGETTIASSPDVEPDLDGLRQAFDEAAVALGLPSAPVTPEPVRTEVRRSQQPETLADQLDTFMRKGMELLDELMAPAQAEETSEGTWTLEFGDAPAEWSDKANAFYGTIRDLLVAEHPALLPDFERGYNERLRIQRERRKVARERPDNRSQAQRTLDFATDTQRTPAKIVEACLQGLSEARKAI